jgi:putative inorganic carbon (HCO3(-)) transporter
MADLDRFEGDNQRRRNLWQTVAWFIVLLCTLPLMSGPIISFSRVPEVLPILLLLFVCAGLGWLWLVIRDRGRNLVTSVDPGLVAILAALVLTTVTSLDPSRSWRVTAHWAAFIVVFYIVVTAVRAGWRPANLVRAYLLILTLYILVGYLQLLSWIAGRLAEGGSLLGNGPVVRISGLANNPNPFAALLAVGLILALGAYLAAPEGRRRWPILLWLIAAAPLVAFHGSRNGWLATVAGLAALLLFRQLFRHGPGRLPRRSVLRVVGFVLVALTAALALVLLLRPGTVNPATASNYANRLIFWQFAVQTWLSSPILGQGPGTYASSFLESAGVPFAPLFVAAHSFLFDSLSEMGLAGLAALGLLFWQTARLAIRSLRESNWQTETPALLAALVAIGAFSLFDTPWIQLKFVTALFLASFVAQVEPAYILSGRRSAWRARLPLIWLPLWAILIVSGIMGWGAMRAYGQGLDAARAGRWPEAITKFKSAQDRLPYNDASFSLAEGYAAGVLSAVDPDYLVPAIDAYETVVDREPGWSLNWANLAALYWQAGRSDQALAAMDRAITLAPNVPLYHLNRGLWLEELGQAQAASEGYQRSLALDPGAGSGDFWSATAARRSAFELIGPDRPDSLDSHPALARAVAALHDSRPLDARDSLVTALERDPDLAEAYLLTTVADIFLAANGGSTSTSSTGEFGQAESLAVRQGLRRVAAVDSSGRLLPLILLWASFEDGVREDQARAAVNRLNGNSVYGFGRDERSTYVRDVFVRLDMPAELLPQLQCPAPGEQTRRHLDLFRTLAERQDLDAVLAALDGAPGVGPDGLTSCLRPASAGHPPNG